MAASIETMLRMEPRRSLRVAILKGLVRGIGIGIGFLLFLSTEKWSS
jgi:hypothetical protein